MHRNDRSEKRLAAAGGGGEWKIMRAAAGESWRAGGVA
jgi:hypothetical protein